MKPSQLPALLDLAHTTKTPLMIWGASGIGKSQILGQWATDNDLPVIDRRLSQMEPSDLIGLPSIVDGTTSWARPCWFPQEHSHGKTGVLFLDEITSAPPQMSAAAYQLVLDRRIGDHVLPDGWMVIAAGNRTQDRGVVHSMPGPLANRFRHVTLEPDLDDLRAYAINKGWETMIPAFLAMRPQLMHRFDARSADPAFPSPRSWEALSTDLQSGVPDSIRSEVLAGHIGEGPALEFEGFLRMASSITPPDVIILNPTTAKLPQDSAVCFATVGALVPKTTQHNLATILRYIDRIENEPNLGAEFAVLFMRDITRQDESIASTGAFISWAAQHAEVIL